MEYVKISLVTYEKLKKAKDTLNIVINNKIVRLDPGYRSYHAVIIDEKELREEVQSVIKSLDTEILDLKNDNLELKYKIKLLKEENKKLNESKIKNNFWSFLNK
jgi:hypothetical protein